MWKYTHKGFLIGIPARDLTDDEAKQFGKRVKESGLYIHVKDKKPKPVIIEDDNKE